LKNTFYEQKFSKHKNKRQGIIVCIVSNLKSCKSNFKAFFQFVFEAPQNYEFIRDSKSVDVLPYERLPSVCPEIQKESRSYHDDDELIPELDFEDEIQNFVYLPSHEDAVFYDRSKRQAFATEFDQEFPTELDKITTKKREPDTESRFDEEGNYEYFYIEINDPSQTRFELKRLKHFSSYQIYVHACREKSETNENIEENPCGPETHITVSTLKKEENDLIPYFDVKVNETDQIKMSWKAPENPNGQILTYTIQYKRIDQEHSKWELICIPHKHLIDHNVLVKVSPGNYSIQIVATSTAGMGDWSDLKFVKIGKSSTNLSTVLYRVAKVLTFNFFT
jgi:hypothetical protein